MAECPFCRCDPYHYVDIGVGREAVAVTCCELGCALFDSRGQDTVTIDRDDFLEIANRLRRATPPVSGGQ